MYLKELLTGQHRVVGYDGLVLYLVMHVDYTFLAGVLQAHVRSLLFAIVTSEEGLHTNTLSNSLF
jgi:hypothetical protein